MRHVDSTAVILLSVITTVRALSIEPNHEKRCVVGDAWAEECKSCICVEPGITRCRITLCASILTRVLDTCKDGEITKVGCNMCVCRSNKRVCTKKRCPQLLTERYSTWPRKTGYSQDALPQLL